MRVVVKARRSVQKKKFPRLMQTKYGDIILVTRIDEFSILHGTILSSEFENCIGKEGGYRGRIKDFNGEVILLNDDKKKIVSGDFCAHTFPKLMHYQGVVIIATSMNNTTGMVKGTVVEAPNVNLHFDATVGNIREFQAVLFKDSNGAVKLSNYPQYNFSYDGDPELPPQ